MSFSMSEASECKAVDIIICDAEFVVNLSDTGAMHIPFDWFPRLLHATPEERMDWILIDDGRGIHWKTIDEDISVPGLMAGRRSDESERSLAKWLAAREQVKAQSL